MVTKIDIEEAYIPIKNLIYFLLVLNLCTIIISSIIAYVASSVLANPIEKLKVVVDKLKDGDLSVRANVLTNDEIGELASSYNQMADNLQRKITDLDNFIYTASHDLKAPISNLEGLFNTIKSEVEFKEELDPVKYMIEKSLQRLKNTIKDLTDISKVQNTHQDDLKIIRLADLFEEVKSDIQQQIDLSEATIEIDFKVEEIKFSLKNLRSIFYNLLSNSIKYASPERKPDIKISSRQDHNFTLITFTDNGLGIKEESIDRVFQMFKRLHDHVEGTGIGLYIVKRIIDNSGGKI